MVKKTTTSKVERKCDGGCGKAMPLGPDECWTCEECERKMWAEYGDTMCPWGWCDGDYDVHHNLLCLPSKGAYGISWAHTLTHRKLMSMFGKDIWTRDGKGRITGLRSGRTRKKQGLEKKAVSWIRS